MTYARLALRHPLEGHYPIDGSLYRTALPISRLLAMQTRSTLVQLPRTTLLRPGFQRPTNFVSFDQDLLFGSVTGRQLSTQGSDLVISALGSLQPGTPSKCPDYVQTGKHRSRGGQLITVGADWQSQPGPTKSDQDNDQDNPQALLVIRPTTQIGWQIKGLICG